MGRKGVILAAGLGTRLYPLTNVISKQLLPIYDKPMIYYPLSVIMQAGIRDVLIITTGDDKDRFVKLLGDGSSFGISIQYKIQLSAIGIGHSFILAKEFIGDDDVLLALGDNIFYGDNLKKDLQSFPTSNVGAQIYAIEVNDPKRFGVIEKDREGNVIKIIEKPENPPSNLAVTGLYFYDNSVVEVAESMKPSNRGEYEITDINNYYLSQGALNVVTFDNNTSWFDTGTFESLVEASIFIRDSQNKTGNCIGCIEMIAYENGWITSDQLERVMDKYKKSQYGRIAFSMG